MFMYVCIASFKFEARGCITRMYKDFPVRVVHALHVSHTSVLQATVPYMSMAVCTS